MRMAFGLVSVLMVAGIVAVILHLQMGSKPAGPVRLGLQARQEVSDLSGRTFMDSVKLRGVSQDGREWVEVTWVDPSGPAASYYGLAVNDRIIRIGDRDVDMFGGEAAAALVVDAFRPQEKWPLTVIRNGQKLLLPQPAAPPPVNAPGSSPPPTNAPGGNVFDSIRKQLQGTTAPLPPDQP